MMKTLTFFFFIMTALTHKLNAFDVTSPLDKFESVKNFADSNNVRQMDELMKKIRSGQKIKNDSNLNYKFLRETAIKEDNVCQHCPKHLLLTEAVNKVVDKMTADPNIMKSAGGDELPFKIAKLKFLFYTSAMTQADGSVSCARYLDFTPDLKPTKFDGQFRLIAEDALSFDKVSEIYYRNPNMKEMVYYYRGEGADKDVVVQAILTKEGGRFRYYRYLPNESEKNPYNLPDLGKTTPPASAVVVKEQPAPSKITTETAPTGLTGKKSEEAGVLDEAANMAKAIKEKNKTQIEFKTKVDTVLGVIPKNIHFMNAKIEQDLVEGLKIKAQSDTSLKGNDAKVTLKNGDKDLTVINLNTKTNGKTDVAITVPYSVRVVDDFPTVSGQVRQANAGQVLNLNLTDKNIEYLRTEVRRNGSTGGISYVLARDLKIDKDVVSVQYGRNEDKSSYASLKHIKPVNDNITLVLDVKVDSNKKASIYYQAQARW